MKKQAKKLLSVILTVMLMLSAVCSVSATETSTANIIESYNCNNCSLSCILYDDGTLYIDGDGSITSHQLSSEIENVVTKVIISDTVTSLNSSFLAGLKFLENVIVSENHPTFTTENGVLFNKEKTILHTYPAGKTEATYIIPDTVSQICPAAFAFSKITSITIPYNVIYIGWQAFASSSLISVKVENEKNHLFIAAHAFENCANLQTIDINANQLYCVSATSFTGTPIMNNDSNWEKGVLYLNDILLAVNPSEVPTEYTIKDGTKLIADSALFYYNYPDANTDGFVKVIIPESVNNIGYDSICLYDSLPTDLIRLGVNSNILEIIMDSDELSKEQFTDLLEWIEKYNGEFTPEAIKNLPNDLYYLVLSYRDFIQYAEYGLNSELYIFDSGYRGIVDENQWKSIGYLLSYTFFFPTYTDGFIFQNDMEMLSGYTTFNHETTEQWIAHTYDPGVEESLSGEKSLTFLNKNTKIYDSPITIWEGYTICGYPDSTAQKYAQKYNRKFVDITNCTHSELAKMISTESTCQREGYSGDVYCQYCGEFLEAGKIIGLSDHSFDEWKTTEAATCTHEGTMTRACSVCDYTETRSIPQKAHDYSTEYRSYDATCTQDALKLMRCTNCWWDITEVYIEGTALGHKDNDPRDGYCDYCGNETEEQKNCSCNCHKGGIAGFFYDLLIFFQKIFGINKQCSCGAHHY